LIKASARRADHAVLLPARVDPRASRHRPTATANPDENGDRIRSTTSDSTSRRSSRWPCDGSATAIPSGNEGGAIACRLRSQEFNLASISEAV
jgi:hypothetical protein